MPSEPRWNRFPRSVTASAVAVPALMLVVFYLWPFTTLIARGVSAAAVGDTFGSRRTWEVAWFTTWQAACSTAATVVIGLVPTWAISRFSFPGRRTLTALLTAVFVMPTVVIAAAVLALLPGSVERGAGAIVAAHVVFNLAVVVRTVGAVWGQLPDDLGHTAAILGASPWQTFRHIVLPLLSPAVAASAAIVFVFSFTSFGVVRVLGGLGRATIEVEVWRRATQLGEIGVAATLALTQLAVLGAVVVAAGRLQRTRATQLGRRERRRPTPPSRRQRPAVYGAALLTMAIVAAPVVALGERSLRGADGYSLDAWRALAGSEVRPGLAVIDPLDALRRSATTAAWATLLAVVAGGLAVVAIDRLRHGGKLLDVGLMLPLGTSAVTVGFGLLITFDSPPVDWRGRWWLVPVGHALVAVPFVVRTGLAAARTIPSELQRAAATLGASPVRAWWTTTAPLLARPLAGGAGLAAAVSLGEFGATSFLSRAGRDTVPLAIARLLGRTGAGFQSQAFALATVLAVATAVIVLVADRLGELDLTAGRDR